MNWFLSRQSRRALPRKQRGTRQQARRAATARLRVPAVEQLENRSLLAALPYGAMPDDTGEYLLGDVYVTVVLLESDPSLSPGDNNPAPQGRGSPAENWATNTIDTIAAVKTKIQDGLNWWEQTLAQSLVGTPAAGRDLLDFTVDWTHADNPVHTGYEPIARTSNDFTLWMYDFLNLVGFNQTGNFSTDIRAYNNFQRDQPTRDYDWSFTIFVVNNEIDQDGVFAPGGQFSRAFSYAGGRFMIVPANRPASTFAHEAAHAFWALDEYAGTTANYLTRRGYYNTPNSNHASNPDPQFVQENSIQANDPAREAAWLGHVTSTSSREMLGWRDTDGDGLFDVLDVPFALEGIGRYDSDAEQYLFSGTSAVRTLPNVNSSGLQNDITINQIREVQYSIDGGSWATLQTLPARTYETALELSIPVSSGDHEIKIRTIDTRTGAMSPEFVGTTTVPKQTPTQGGVGGFVYQDDDADGTWDSGEPPIPDWAINLVDDFGVELDLVRRVEPSQYSELTLLNNIHAEVVLSAVGSEVANMEVRARTSTRAAGAGRVFVNNSVVLGSNLDTWNSNRQLRIDFDNPISSLSIKAYGAGTAASFGRLEIYNASGELLDRYTTGSLSNSGFETMTLRRPEGDIAYAIAHGHAGTDVVLDTLQWGPFASATTNTLGAYSLAGLPAGAYRIKIDIPPLHFIPGYPTGVVPLILAAGQALGDINFGLARVFNPWHFAANSLNVSGDTEGDVSPIDALLVINWLNAHSSASLPGAATPLIDGYVDVNDDGYCTPLDALMVINFLNVPEGEEGEGGGGEEGGGESLVGSGPALAPHDNSPAEGEEIDGTLPHTAAAYYARLPLHFLAIAGDDELCIHDDLADHTHSLGDLDDHHLQPLLGSSSISFAAASWLALDADSRDDGSVGSALQSLSEELDRAESRLSDALPADVLTAVLNRTRHAAAALDEQADELDAVLEAIAPEVADGWHAAIERILRRLPHGLG